MKKPIQAVIDVLFSVLLGALAALAVSAIYWSVPGMQVSASVGVVSLAMLIGAIYVREAP